ncbi:uncharacterized protein LOC116797826 isoform X3 [Chiroxiphia lanceolata]|uniref:uncharacterized protein LOC116797826 isoform X3 n=1 Tax=Chiroxiphia lanceolata TaxID=296741 RepID=UPI0013CEF79F|nr:uncharacterized protein LOC116797826 isoform X3 [Chiroxiphia lanceolata]
MGAAVSAIERATVDGLLSVAKKTGHTLPRAELVDFLYWCRRRGLLTSSDQLFDIEHWEKIGSELWQSVQNGQKGSKQMAQIFRIVREMIQQVHADAEIATALQKALDCSTQPKEKEKDEEGKDSCSTLIDWEAKSDPPPSYPPIAAPMFRGEFEDLIPPWNPNEISAGTAAAPSAPPPPEAMEVDPAKVPLPEEEKASPQNPLVDELRLQREQMAKLLGAMQEIDSKGGKGKMWEQELFRIQQRHLHFESLEQKILAYCRWALEIEIHRLESQEKTHILQTQCSRKVPLRFFTSVGPFRGSPDKALAEAVERLRRNEGYHSTARAARLWRHLLVNEN